MLDKKVNIVKDRFNVDFEETCSKWVNIDFKKTCFK
jgi:hypothetical protein